MSNLSKINLYELVGINNAPEEEKQELTSRIVRIAMGRAMERAMEERKLDMDEAEKISTEITDSLEVQNRLVELCPSLPKYTEEEVNKIKIEILQKQVEDVVNILSANSNKEITDFQEYLNLPIEEINEDELLEKVQIFRSYQNNLFNR